MSKKPKKKKLVERKGCNNIPSLLGFGFHKKLVAWTCPQPCFTYNGIK
jgi:hypothetical protein